MVHIVYHFRSYSSKIKSLMEEVEEIINSGKWEVPGQFSKNSGGILACCDIIDPSSN